MNVITEKLINNVLDTDPTVSADQRHAAVAILAGRVPVRWPSYLRQDMVALPHPAADAQSASPRKVYLRRHEAAAYLGCSVRHIDGLKHDGVLPFHRMGRHLIVFKMEDLDAVMRNVRVDAGE